jgi:hypothetical protein
MKRFCLIKIGQCQQGEKKGSIKKSKIPKKGQSNRMLRGN